MKTTFQDLVGTFSHARVQQNSAGDELAELVPTLGATTCVHGMAQQASEGGTFTQHVNPTTHC